MKHNWVSIATQNTTKEEKMEKEIYRSPELELIKFAAVDIITASGGNDIEEDSGENDGEWM